VPPTPVSRQAPQGLDTAERYELYDVLDDPGERRNRSADEPARRAALAEHVRATRRALRLSGHAW
jgi:hypothetical protein